MKALLSVLILASVLTAFAGPHPRPQARRHHHPSYRISRIYEPVSWKTIAAGGAAAGGVVAAYKISDGMEEGLKTVAREKPEVFSGILTPFAWPLHVITVAGLVYAGYRIWLRHRNKPQTERNQNHEN